MARIKTIFRAVVAKVWSVRRKILVSVVILVVAAAGVAAYFFGTDYVTRTQTEIRAIKDEQIRLGADVAQLQASHAALEQRAADDKKVLDDTIKASQDKITALEGKVVELEKKVANQFVAPPKPAAIKASSIYDRVVSDNPEAKQRMINAIKLIENTAPSYFNILQSQVQEVHAITTIGCRGGVQVQRTIYISYLDAACLNSTPDSIFASVIVHEAYHVYNVYVNKVYVSGKPQELPSLYAQRATFDVLGVPQSFRTYVESLIAYYEGLPG